MQSGVLLESPKGSGRFPWSDSEEWKGTWISSIQGINENGSLRVEVLEFSGGADTRTGVADVKAVKGGFSLVKWRSPLKDPAKGKGRAQPASGGFVYRAVLGAGDHFNSAGERLSTVGDVLRQDRANYHKGKGDAGDGDDPVFDTFKARESMGKLKVIPVGLSEAALKKAVMDGTPKVEVEATTSALKVKIVG